MNKNRSSFSPYLTFSHISKNQFAFNNLCGTSTQRSVCQFHRARNASFIDTRTNILYCWSCAQKLQNHGKYLNKLDSPQPVESLEHAYNQYQQAIKEHIKIYNSKLTHLIQALNDMQIRDLMYFNELLQHNDQNYEKAMGLQFMSIPTDKIRRIYEIEEHIMKAINDPIRSYSARTTFDPKNKKTVSQNFSNSKLNQRKRKKSLNDQIEKQKKFDMSVEQTPQKIIFRKNQPKQQSVGMFQKIAICESVNQMSFDQSQDKQNMIEESNKKKKQPKQDYRYDDFQDE